MVEETTTQIGINVELRDKVKIHVVKYKNKYETMSDFVNKAVTRLIEDDENDDSNPTQ